MLLILEIILIIFAWMNGWKWLSLLPISISLLLGLLGSFIIERSGGSEQHASEMGMFLDLISIVILMVMVYRSPKLNNKLDSTKTK